MRQGHRLGALTTAAAFALAFVAFLGIGASAAVAAPPTLTMDPVTTHSLVTAHLTGEVEVPADGLETYWCLETAVEGTEAWSGFCFQGPIQPNESVPVEQDISGLQPGTHYEARLSALNFNEFVEEHTAPVAFTTDAASNAPALAPGLTSALARTHAHVTGTLDPEGGNVDTVSGPIPIHWEFQYTKASGPVAWQGAGGGTIEGSEAAGESPTPPIAVAADLTGLATGTEYLFRLRATYGGEEATSSNGSFETLSSVGPDVTTSAATHLHPTSAYLEGTVNPGEESTVYWFEYGSGNCATTTCTAVPAPKIAAGKGVTDVAASYAIGGLSPETTYHFRLLAENASGTAAGGDQTFTTSAPPAEVACPNEARRAEQPRSDVLGDCRAWELASPGGSVDIVSDSGRTVAAAGESPGLPMAVKFSAPPFGDVAGAGAISDFLAQRDAAPGTAGWSVHGLTPPQEALSFRAAGQGADPLYELFNSDLTRGIFRSWSSLPGTSPNAAQVPNLYLREDARQSGAGAYSLVTDSEIPLALPPSTLGSRRPWIAGASADLEHVVFETTTNRTADATGSNGKLYKSDHGVDQLIKASSACAGSEAGSDSPCSMAGIGAVGGGSLGHYTPHVVSDDGSRTNFTSPFPRTGEPSTRPGVVSKLYQLDDGGTASKADDVVIQLNASESPSPEAARAAIYQDASSSGSRVFFTSTEQLTSTPAAGLYMWQRQSEDETQSVTVDATGGEFTLTAHAQPTVGQGTLTEGSTEVTGVTGSFTVGQTISAPGIPAGTTVTEVGSFSFGSEEKIVLSAPATENGVQALRASFDATTAPLAWNASAPQVASALEGLSLIGAGNVAVSGGPGGVAPFEVEFTGGLAGVDVMPLTADASGLSGGASTAAVATTNDVHNLTLIAAGGSDLLGAAEDGTRVYYSTGGGIDLWTDDGTAAGSTSFVAASSMAVVHDNVRGLDMFWNFSVQPKSRVSPDGRFLLFESTSGAGLPPAYAHGQCGPKPCNEAYVYRADSSTPADPDIVCASCNLAKPGALGDTFLNIRYGGGAALTTSHLNRALSDDGRRVFFDTGEALVPEDTNGAVDVYEYDVTSGETHLISSGAGHSDSYLMDASADGSDVFFTTREQLAGWDEDLAYDLYDARVGGGFPEPAAQTAACQGESCRSGGAPATPGATAPGSVALVGPGNPKPTRKTCPKGKRAVKKGGKTRCVKKHTNHKRTANTNRRAGK